MQVTFETVLQNVSLPEAVAYVLELMALPSSSAPPPTCQRCQGPLSLVQATYAFFPLDRYRADGTLSVSPVPSCLQPAGSKDFVCTNCGEPAAVADNLFA
jgi:hypothetical protein